MALQNVIILDETHLDKVIVIRSDDAIVYRESLLAVLKRLDKAFYGTQDLSLCKWINKHGEVLDRLAVELKLR